MIKNLNLKPFVYALVIISFVSWLVLVLISGIDKLELLKLIKLLPNVVFIDLIVIGLFIKWGWQFKLFQGWLVPFPNLNGTWQGAINSNWINPETGAKPNPIPVILTIKQTFRNISCVMRTAEMTSYSFAEEFKIDEASQIKQLVYTYTSKPLLSVAIRSAQHDGTIIFDIIGTPIEKLKGQYFTARKSSGEITLAFREKKLLSEMPKDLGDHPLSK